MDISRINELLQENEQIRTKIIELKRKLNLKNYNEQQKEQIRLLIKKLKGEYIKNQSICSNLSEIKAETFANLICRKLNKKHLNYRVQCVNLKFPKESQIAGVLDHYKNRATGMFLVVTNREVKSTEELPTNDLSLIPITYTIDHYSSNISNPFDLAILGNKKINLFNNPDVSKVVFMSNLKMFNLGNAGENEKVGSSFTKLRNEIKDDMGIWTKQSEIKEERQL